MTHWGNNFKGVDVKATRVQAVPLPSEFQAWARAIETTRGQADESRAPAMLGNRLRRRTTHRGRHFQRSRRKENRLTKTMRKTLRKREPRGKRASE